MKLIDYLRTRHPYINALTKPEAKILHLGYPMVTGWVERHGQIELDEEIVKRLVEARKRRKVEVNKQKQQYHKKKAKNKRKVESKMSKKMASETEKSLHALMNAIVKNGFSDEARMKKNLLQT